MKQDFIKYLQCIDLTQTLYKRIEAIYEFYQKLCPEKITGLFVSDYITMDGERNYENLYFFSERYIMKAKHFIQRDDFNMTLIKEKIYHLQIQKLDYDFNKATEKSRLYLEFILDTGMVYNFKASKKNCDYLKNVLFQYVLPNLGHSVLIANVSCPMPMRDKKKDIP